MQHFQRSQHPKPGELTIYGNAITKVVLAAANEGTTLPQRAAAGRFASDIFIGLNLN
jgi:hypothetical protein